LSFEVTITVKCTEPKCHNALNVSDKTYEEAFRRVSWDGGWTIHHGTGVHRCPECSKAKRWTV
jgi:hypothetical protein